MTKVNRANGMVTTPYEEDHCQKGSTSNQLDADWGLVTDHSQRQTIFKINLLLIEGEFFCLQGGQNINSREHWTEIYG